MWVLPRNSLYNLPYETFLLGPLYNHGLKISATKSYLIFFTHSHTVTVPLLYLYGTQLQSCFLNTFLGLIFDYRLTWKEHFSNMKENAQRRLRLLKTP